MYDRLPSQLLHAFDVPRHRLLEPLSPNVADATMSDPNLDANAHVPDRGPAVFAVTTATLVVASVFVAARIISRWFIVKNVTWDDWVMMLAWLIAFFLSFTIDLGTYNGLGRHDENISGDELGTLRRCEYVFSILYVCIATSASGGSLHIRSSRHLDRSGLTSSCRTLP